MLKRLCILLIACLVPALAGAAEVRIGPGEVSNPYLFAAMRDAKTRQPVVALLSAQSLPAWTKAIVNGGNYVAGPSRAVLSPMAGATVYNACKPHDCGYNNIQILVTADKKRAYALLQIDNRQIFLGAPDDVAKAVLKAAKAE